MKFKCVGGSLMILMLLLSSGQAKAACSEAAARMSSERITAFVQTPDKLATLYPDGSDLMENEVAQLAATSKVVLEPINALIRVANRGQRTAIGEGLARAYRACQLKDNDLARAIRELATRSSSSDLIVAFQRGLDAPDTKVGRSDEPPASPRSSGYLSGTGGSGLSLNSKRLDLANPFAPVEIRRR
jgi:hypothetical protein